MPASAETIERLACPTVPDPANASDSHRPGPFTLPASIEGVLSPMPQEAPQGT